MMTAWLVAVAFGLAPSPFAALDAMRAARIAVLDAAMPILPESGAAAYPTIDVTHAAKEVAALLAEDSSDPFVILDLITN